MIRLPEIILPMLAASILTGCFAAPPVLKDESAIRSVAPERRDADLLIRDVRIVTGTGAVIERGAVVIRGERIDRVIDDSFEGPAVQVIDGRGMTLLPGFIDTHVHLVTGPKPADAECEQILDHLRDDLDRILAAGVTTMMSVGDPAGILRVKSALRASTLFGPDLLVTGPVFAAPGHPGGERPGFCNGQFPVTDAVAARAEIARLAAEGVDAIKVLYDSRWPPRLEPRLLAVIVDAAHGLLIPVVAHVQTTEDAREALSLGVDKLVHLPHLGELDPQLLSLIRERNVPIATTVHLYAPIQREGVSLNHGEGEISAERLVEVRHHMEEIAMGLRQLQSAGVPLAFGTDRYRGEPAFHSAQWHEIETLGQALAPLDVIRIMTLDAARFIGMADEIGSIEPGKRADLVLVRGDPTVDVSALIQVETVIQRGLPVAGRRP